MITTMNLQLLEIQPVHIQAFLRSKSDLAELLQVRVPGSWPHFPEAFSPPGYESGETHLSSSKWPGYFFIYPEVGVLVGNGGFIVQPDDPDTIEIGYEIASEFRNRGFATEAACGMIDYAFTNEEIQTVIAHTLAEKNASNAVLKKVGMKFKEELKDPEEGKVWRWQIRRKDYELNQT